MVFKNRKFKKNVVILIDFEINLSLNSLVHIDDQKMMKHAKTHKYSAFSQNRAKKETLGLKNSTEG